MCVSQLDEHKYSRIYCLKPLPALLSNCETILKMSDDERQEVEMEEQVGETVAGTSKAKGPRGKLLMFNIR